MFIDIHNQRTRGNFCLQTLSNPWMAKRSTCELKVFYQKTFQQNHHLTYATENQHGYPKMMGRKENVSFFKHGYFGYQFVELQGGVTGVPPSKKHQRCVFFLAQEYEISYVFPAMQSSNRTTRTTNCQFSCKFVKITIFPGKSPICSCKSPFFLAPKNAIAKFF